MTFSSSSAFVVSTIQAAFARLLAHRIPWCQVRPEHHDRRAGCASAGVLVGLGGDLGLERSRETHHGLVKANRCTAQPCSSDAPHIDLVVECQHQTLLIDTSLGDLLQRLRADHLTQMGGLRPGKRPTQRFGVRPDEPSVSRVVGRTQCFEDRLSDRRPRTEPIAVVLRASASVAATDMPSSEASGWRIPRSLR